MRGLKNTINRRGELNMIDEERDQVYLWGMLCHLSALLLLVGIPLGNILGPLVVWLIKREDDPFIDEQGKESLNFQISMTIYSLVAALLCLALVGIFLLLAVAVADLVLIVMASVKTRRGESFRYPCTIRFIN